MRSRRGLITTCAVLWCTPLSGCASVIVDQSQFRALGAFAVSHTQLTRDASAVHARGFGLYIAHGSLGLGWVEQRQIVLPQTDEGFHVSMLGDEIVSGMLAEHIASGECDAACQRWIPASPALRVVHHTQVGNFPVVPIRSRTSGAVQ